MNKKRLLGIATAVILLLLVAGGYWRLRQVANISGAIGAGAAANLQLPPGFKANIFASGLNGPRFLHFGPDGALYVADRRNDRIVRLPDANGDGAADEIAIFADEVNNVHSLVYHQGAWYAGVPSGVLRLVDADGDGAAETRTTLVDNYPTAGTHSTRTVAFLPDGRLVVSIGSSCNVCSEEDPRRAGIVVYDGAEATGERPFATGLRNAVGLAIHPTTGELWATNNGRDLLGDDLPPETINIIHEGANFGWPVCHSGNIVDPDMGYEGACEGVAQPIATMQAHVAPLGLAFYTGTAFPEAYRDDLFIALHGSWNRSVPVGYSVVRLPMADERPSGPVEDFATGWLQADGSANGRPVGLATGPDGALYVSDDKGGFIYRIYYAGN